ncbi:MAG: hypothetical protein KAI47_20725 [Deltaproteobacteria bacterium]|nr:hypothetical protein [Deltaproteobacteria bacterium]
MAKKAAKKATKKKATKKPARKAAPAPREVLVVASKVKEYIKALGLQSSADVVPALSDKIYAILDAAAERTKGNNRATVRPYDL